MSRIDEIRVAIVARLAAVPGIGRVHDRERDVRDPVRLEQLFFYETPGGGGAKLRGWWLRRSAAKERGTNIAHTLCREIWTLHGYLALDDEGGGEKLLDDLVESFRDAVRADPTFGGVCALAPQSAEPYEPHERREPEGVEVVESGLVTFGGALCHGVVLRLRTWSYL